MSSEDRLPSSLQAIQQRIAPFRRQLAQHPLYSSIKTADHVRLFMESHVFAVWDFMSLLKTLQRALTVVEVPWTPPAYPSSCRFINEIVLGEESDQYEGRSMSHFEIYQEAMRRAGAKTQEISHVLAVAARCRGANLPELEAVLDQPLPGHQFAKATFRLLSEGSVAAQAAAFTFGREDAIPDMFRSLIRDLNNKVEGDLTLFLWYLERHIEVDGEEHGPLSLRMVADVCGEDPELWDEAARAAEEALIARLSLWDGIYQQLQNC